MIPFDGCNAGLEPEPFLEIECMGEEEEIMITRRMALNVATSPVVARSIANHAGVAPDDMTRFLEGLASLTHPARARIRAVLG